MCNVSVNIERGGFKGQSSQDHRARPSGFPSPPILFATSRINPACPEEARKSGHSTEQIVLQRKCRADSHLTPAESAVSCSILSSVAFLSSCLLAG